MWVLALLGCGPTCGLGTMEVDGVCRVRARLEPASVEDTATTVVCDDTEVPRGDTCVPLDAQLLWLPFPAGVEAHVSQGHNGFFSHSGDDVWAVDFPAEEGDTIVAVRAGTVWQVKEDSAEGCAEPECADLGNRVLIDHGDGTFAAYWHLQLDGALVDVGQLVGRGEPIGLVGQTGWAVSPHVHLQVDDLFAQSLPIRFAEITENDGVPYAGDVFVSENTPEPAPTLGWSSCPSDLYRPFGVTLTSATPCAVAATGTPYALEGVVTGPNLVVGQFSTTQGTWLTRCVVPDETGHFEATLEFAASQHGDHTNLILQSADGDCLAYQGFSASPKIELDLESR